ncbi:MAG: type IV secretory system conjugative DNA transfer family protein [Pseudobdellovibrionaceae bacterium]
MTEKIINSFNIENEYYRTVQFDVLRNVLEIFKEASVTPNFIKLRQAISDPKELLLLAEKTTNPALRYWAFDFINMNKDKRREMVSGLASNLGFFATSEVAELFNTSEPQINISEAMKKNLILYFQLPVLKSPILGKAVAKMVLQDVQGAVSERHASGASAHPFFSVYLDDFTEYLTPQFVSLLNKSRSANVGVVFAHQAIGDLEALGPEVKNQIMTNSNLKVFMRTNEPDSAEYFSKIIGTKETTKITKRQKQVLFGAEVTDDGSIREVEEFIFHPNFFKSKLGVGEAVIVLPHTRGAKSLLLKFIPRPDLPHVGLPQVKKKAAEVLTVEPAAAVTPSASIASLAARRV